MAEPRPLTPAGAAYAARYAADGRRGMMKLPIVIAVIVAFGLVTVALVGTIELADASSLAVMVVLASLWAASAIAEYRRLERVVVAARDDQTLRWSVVQSTVSAARDGVPHPELRFKTFLHVITRAEQL
ncbi:MAG TPA: hypothetical protein VGG28_30245 [Kofleriaceae bacterium]|jgi:hypothetical protein